jgi:hypothetical protein
VALAAGIAADAAAFVPPSEKIATAVARANRAAGRPQSLILSVALRGGDDRTLARGELATDGRGLARLELADGGTSERHLLRGGEYLAARDGRRIADPAPWLPPLYLLQARDADRLLAGVLSLGGATETVLGRHDGAICYVLGGRDLAPPANESAAQFGSTGPRGAVWARREDFRIVRIDRSDGTRFVLGPPRDHDGVTLPEWIRIERPGAANARLEILSARTSRFDPSVTFGVDWLFGR